MPQTEEQQPHASSPSPQGPQPYPFAYPYFVPPEEDEIDLLDLFLVLKKRWKLIALVVLLGTGAAVAYALLATPIYRAQAVIAPPAEKTSKGISAALGAFGGLGAEIAGSMGISVGPTDANRLQALLQSHRLVERVVTKHKLIPVLFPKLERPSISSTVAPSPTNYPSIWDAERILRKSFGVQNNPKSGVLYVYFEWDATETAKTILRAFLDELAVLVQEDELRRINSNTAFARKQLATATDPIMISRLQSLLSDQVEKAMMAQNVENLAYELIDPPAVPDRAVKPKKALTVSLGLIGSLFIAILLVFLAERIQRPEQQSCGLSASKQ